MQAKKILIVDTDHECVRALSERLVAVGYAVVVAHDGEEALVKLKSEDPDLMVLDVLLPKMSCFQLMRLMQKDEIMRSVPVFLLSSRKEMRDYLTEFHFKEFFHKPLPPEELLKKIEEWIGTSGQRKAGAKKRVILLGCYKFIKEKIRKFLTRAGWEVSVAYDSHAAYDIAVRVYPDLILCEYFSPEMEGHTYDTRAFTQRLAKDRFLARIPLYVYCTDQGIMDAATHYPRSRLIHYRESADLLRELANRIGIRVPG